MNVRFNKNFTVLHNLSVRLRKPIGETKIPKFILTFNYGIYTCLKSGVQYHLKNSPYHLE